MGFLVKTGEEYRLTIRGEGNAHMDRSNADAPDLLPGFNVPNFPKLIIFIADCKPTAVRRKSDTSRESPDAKGANDCTGCSVNETRDMVIADREYGVTIWRNSKRIYR